MAREPTRRDGRPALCGLSADVGPGPRYRGVPLGDVLPPPSGDRTAVIAPALLPDVPADSFGLSITWEKIACDPTAPPAGNGDPSYGRHRVMLWRGAQSWRFGALSVPGDIAPSVSDPLAYASAESRLLERCRRDYARRCRAVDNLPDESPAAAQFAQRVALTR
ncbi:MAG: hypothetical protein ACR2NO_02885 [Chloroflexota bacterium]